MSSPRLSLYRELRFGAFVLDSYSGDLTKNGRPVRLQEKPRCLLLALAERDGELIGREELREQLWPGDTFVSFEDGLNAAMSKLREVLDDDPQSPRYIETVRGRGYRFIARVEKVAKSAPVWPAPAPVPVLSPQPAALAVPAPTLQKKRRYKLLAAATAALLAVVALAGWAAWRFHWRTAPREHRQIVLADFTNTTGDTTFDQTLKRALEIDLDQSPYMDVLSERDEVAALLLMGRPSDTPIGSDVATEICERTNREVLLTGAISKLGSRYLLTLTGSDCNSGKRLAVAKAEANSREGVLDAMDSVAEQVRKQLNESAQSLKDHDVPLRVVTTSSLEALRAYSFGKYLQSQHKGLLERLAAYQKAIELDPEFAMAYRELGMENYNLSQFAQASQYFKKAFDLSGHLSTQEQLYIRACYYAYGQQNFKEGIKEFQLLASIYPNDALSTANVMDESIRLGLYAAAIATGEQGVKHFPNEVVIYANLSEAYRGANRFDDSERAARTAAQLSTGDTGLHLALFEIAFARQDQAALARESQWFDAEDAGATVWYYPSFRGSAAAALGNYREAERFFQKAIEAALRANLPETADRIRIDQALAERMLGFPEQARATLRRVSKSNVDEAGLAAAWAELGDTALAEEFLSAHKGTSPDTLLTYEYLPRIQAILALEHRKPLEAIAALETSRPYEMRNYVVPALRGEAYLEARQPDLAVNEFRKIIDNPGIDSTSVLYPLAHLGAARAYAMENKKVESRHEYETLFIRWKDADAGLPILKQAKQEYARLNTQ